MLEKRKHTLSQHTYAAKSRYQGEVAERYLERRTSTPQWQREQMVVGTMIDSFPEGSCILDTPVGTGRFLPLYCEGNHVAHGLDISSHMLRQAESMGSSKGRFELLIQADMESIPAPHSAYDYVVCTRFMNWVPLEVFVRILAEFDRVARRGIVVEVRMSKPLGVPALVKNLGIEMVSRPRLVGRLLPRPLRRRITAGMFGVKKSLTGETSKTSVNHSGGNSYNYFLHKSTDVAHLFDEQDMVVEKMAVINERTDYLRRESNILMMYMLRKRTHKEHRDPSPSIGLGRNLLGSD